MAANVLLSRSQFSALNSICCRFVVFLCVVVAVLSSLHSNVVYTEHVLHTILIETDAKYGEKKKNILTHTHWTKHISETKRNIKFETFDMLCFDNNGLFARLLLRGSGPVLLNFYLKWHLSDKLILLQRTKSVLFEYVSTHRKNDKLLAQVTWHVSCQSIDPHTNHFNGTWTECDHFAASEYS